MLSADFGREHLCYTNNEAQLYTEMADGTDISYIDSERHRKFFSRFSYNDIVRWKHTQNMAKHKDEYFIYDRKGEFFWINQEPPKGKNFIGYVISANEISDNSVFRETGLESKYELMIAFSNGYMKTIEVNLFEKSPTTEGLERYFKGYNLRSTAFMNIHKQPVYIRLENNLDDYENPNILTFRFMNEVTVSYMDDIYEYEPT